MPATQELTCPHEGCGKKFPIQGDQIGTKIACPHCGNHILISSESSSESSSIQTPTSVANNSPSILSCHCNHCPGVIDFPAESLGQEVACPRCGLTTVLYRGQPPPAMPEQAPKLPWTPRSNRLRWRIAAIGVAALLSVSLIVAGGYYSATLLQGRQAGHIKGLGYATTEHLQAGFGTDEIADKGVLRIQETWKVFLVIQVSIPSSHLASRDAVSASADQTYTYDARRFVLNLRNGRKAHGDFISMAGEDGLRAFSADVRTLAA